MRGMSLERIADACGGAYVGPQEKKTIEVTGVTSDSRRIEEGFLFAALKGERVDGHRFVPQAMEKGAACVLVEVPPKDPKGPYIVVDSCFQALKDLAEYYRKITGIRVVGIAGSVGKTSTKEMVASVLSQKYSVWKTEGNFNNELGVPLTVFGIREEHEVAVLELGISDFGEMHRLSKIARPDICIMTNIGLCHLENLKSRDGILKAKSEIFDFAAKDCIACLNGDDDKLITLRGREGIRPCFFGKEKENDIYADRIDNLGLEGTACDICTEEGRIRVTIPIPGEHMIYNALAGAAAGLALGLSLEEIRAGIEALKPTVGRNHILHGPKYTVIDDCYNANPVSMRAALDVLSYAPGRKVALLGDMGELGDQENLLHYEVGAYATEKQIDRIVCTGKLAEHMARGAKDTIRKSPEAACSVEVLYYPDRERLLADLPGILSPGDTVLVKASHFMGFEKVVEETGKLQ